MFERHSFTTQAFIPMAKGEWGGGVGEPAMERTEGEGGMLVVVALNGEGASRLPFSDPVDSILTILALALDDKPDLSTLKAFLTSPSQGISYNTGVWRTSLFRLSLGHPMLAYLSAVKLFSQQTTLS